MDQETASIDYRRQSNPVTIAAPHEWDGIGQALRAAYRDHRDPPTEIARVLHTLDNVD